MIVNTEATTPEPDRREPRPHRQAQIEGGFVAGERALDPAEQHPGEQHGEQQQDQRREHVEPEARPRGQQLGDEVDLDVGAAVADAGKAPEHGDAEHEPRDVEGVRDRGGQDIAADRRDEHQHGDRREEQAGDPLDQGRQPLEPPGEAPHPVDRARKGWLICIARASATGAARDGGAARGSAGGAAYWYSAPLSLSDRISASWMASAS